MFRDARRARSEARDLLALFRHARIARHGDVVSTIALEDLLRALFGVAVVGVDGNQDIAITDLAFVGLGLVLRDAKADQTARDATDGSACGRAAQRRHQRAGSD